MNIGFLIFGYALAGYFLAAIFVPRIRFRWGYRRSLWLASDKNRERLPKMGTLSCFGSSIFFGAFTSFFLMNDAVAQSALPFLVVGFIMALIGQIIDTRGGGTWKKY